MPIGGTKESRTEVFIHVLEHLVLEKRYLGVNSLEQILNSNDPINPFEWISRGSTIPRTETHPFETTFRELVKMGVEWGKIKTGEAATGQAQRRRGHSRGYCKED